MNLLGGWRRWSGSSEAGRNASPSAGNALEEEDDWGVDVEKKLKLPTSAARASDSSSASSKGASIQNGGPGRPLAATAVRPNSQQSSRDRQLAAERERRRAEEESRRHAEERRRAEEERRRAEDERRRAEEKRLLEEEEQRRIAQAVAESNKEEFFTVQLPFYDLSNGLAKFVPAALLSGYKFEGVWHTGVRVFGKEIWFGGCVLESDFDESPFGVPQRVSRLGKTSRTREELMEFIHDELAKSYNTKTYDVLRRNCNHFSNELVQFLLPGLQIPEEVLLQPQWAQSGALVQVLRPALNAWLGGFGAQGSAAAMAEPRVRHMTRAEKVLEQRRLESQWKEWVEERKRERAIEEAEQRREAEEEEFQSWMLDQHQRMQEEDQAAERRKREAEEQQAAQRKQEAEQTLRDILASAEVVDAVVIEWAVTEAKAAGVEATAPYLLRDAEYAVRKKSQP